MPRNVRRLTVAEYEQAAAAVVGFDVQLSNVLPEGVRQSGFTPSDEATVDALFASRLDSVAKDLARRAVSSGSIADCAADTSDACGTGLVRKLAARAFRRPLSADEVVRYAAVFRAGAEDGDGATATELLLTTLLESPSMLYLTALGPPPDTSATASPMPESTQGASARAVDLGPFEVASLLSFALTGRPPDTELFSAAESGRLGDAADVQKEASRLLQLAPTRYQFQRFVDEWLGLDALSRVAKDSTAYPDFPARRQGITDEAHAFVDAVMIEKGGALSELLTGNVGPFEQRRHGILEQRAFLARYAHDLESAPVLRGVAVLRRVLCRDLRTAAELGIDISFPPFDPAVPTRERYAEHAASGVCAGCHGAIDGIGFTFEGFDTTGDRRTSDAGRAVDTSGVIDLASGKLDLRDSAELARALASDPEAAECLSRQVFRFATGHTETASEDAFVEHVEKSDAPSRTQVVRLVTELVTSEWFRKRRAP